MGKKKRQGTVTSKMRENGDQNRESNDQPRNFSEDQTTTLEECSSEFREESKSTTGELLESDVPSNLLKSETRHSLFQNISQTVAQDSKGPTISALTETSEKKSCDRKSDDKVNKCSSNVEVPTNVVIEARHCETRVSAGETQMDQMLFTNPLILESEKNDEVIKENSLISGQETISEILTCTKEQLKDVNSTILNITHLSHKNTDSSDESTNPINKSLQCKDGQGGDVSSGTVTPKISLETKQLKNEVVGSPATGNNNEVTSDEMQSIELSAECKDPLKSDIIDNELSLSTNHACMIRDKELVPSSLTFQRDLGNEINIATQSTKPRPRGTSETKDCADLAMPNKFSEDVRRGTKKRKTKDHSSNPSSVSEKGRTREICKLPSISNISLEGDLEMCATETSSKENIDLSHTVDTSVSTNQQIELPNSSLDKESKLSGQRSISEMRPPIGSNLISSAECLELGTKPNVSINIEDPLDNNTTTPNTVIERNDVDFTKAKKSKRNKKGKRDSEALNKENMCHTSKSGSTQKYVMDDNIGKDRVIPSNNNDSGEVLETKDTNNCIHGIGNESDVQETSSQSPSKLNNKELSNDAVLNKETFLHIESDIDQSQPPTIKKRKLKRKNKSQHSNRETLYSPDFQDNAQENVAETQNKSKVQQCNSKRSIEEKQRKLNIPQMSAKEHMNDGESFIENTSPPSVSESVPEGNSDNISSSKDLLTSQEKKELIAGTGNTCTGVNGRTIETREKKCILQPQLNPQFDATKKNRQVINKTPHTQSKCVDRSTLCESSVKKERAKIHISQQGPDCEMSIGKCKQHSSMKIIDTPLTSQLNEDDQNINSGKNEVTIVSQNGEKNKYTSSKKHRKKEKQQEPAKAQNDPENLKTELQVSTNEQNAKLSNNSTNNLDQNSNTATPGTSNNHDNSLKSQDTKKNTRKRQRKRNKCLSSTETEINLHSTDESIMKKSNDNIDCRNETTNKRDNKQHRNVTDDLTIDSQSREQRIHSILRKKLLERAEEKIRNEITSANLSATEQSERYLDQLTKNLKLLTGSKDISKLDIENSTSSLHQNDPHDGNNDEEEIEFRLVQRTTFQSFSCHICKAIEGKQGTGLKKCLQCKMISYCSKEHQRQHWPVHKDLCKVICKFCKRDKITHLFEKAKGLSPEEFRQYRVRYVNECIKEIGRDLELWEREMFYYAQVCHTCYECDRNKLVHCEKCLYVHYCCEEHLQENHITWCKDFTLYGNIIRHQAIYGMLQPLLPTTISSEYKKLPPNMRTHLSEISNISEQSDPLNYAILTDIGTCPLTVLFAVEKCYSTVEAIKSLTVHMVGAELHFEVDTLKKWEVFLLHYIPNIDILKVVFVGPELQLNLPAQDIQDQNKCCEQCCENRRHIVFDFCPGLLYHEYTTSSKFCKPDLICALNAGLYRSTGFDGKDTWPSTIIAMLRSPYVPVVVTAYTAEELPLDVKRLQTFCPVKIILPPIENPFSSSKPSLNFITEEKVPVIFKNFYVSIVQGTESAVIDSYKKS